MKWLFATALVILLDAPPFASPGPQASATPTPLSVARHITVPQMRVFFVIVMVLLSLDIARAYDIVRIMTEGGPAHRTELIWTYAGQLAIRGSQFGMASAMSMAGVVLGVGFTFYLFRQMMQLRKDMG